MNERTRTYLEGRFADYYRRASLDLPPSAGAREWGYIPFTGGEGTTMVRHQSLLDMGDPAQFLVDTAPRHVYFSAATYDDPGNRDMEAKGWRGADLIFDLDADHLPGVDPEADSYAEMLAACKDALYRLLDLLERDFGFDEADTEVVFSGGRGYHVHVRDPGVRDLDSPGRREVVDYLRAIDLDVDDLIQQRPTERGVLRKTLRSEGGWGRRIHEELLDLAEDVRGRSDEEAIERLTEYPQIGETRARKMLDAFRTNMAEIEAGNLEPGVAQTLVKQLAPAVVADATAPIDEPVTTDVRRLIRFPGTLHGGSGLAVRHIPRDDLEDFDPLVDAVPDRFRGQRILVEVTDPGPVDVGVGTSKVDAGIQSVREYVGVFLMARGRAEKAPEGQA